MFSFYPLLVILAPLIAAFFTALPKRYVSDRSYTIGWWALVAGFAASIPILWQVLQSAEPTSVVLFATPRNVLPCGCVSMIGLPAIMMVVFSASACCFFAILGATCSKTLGLPDL